MSKSLVLPCCYLKDGNACLPQFLFLTNFYHRLELHHLEPVSKTKAQQTSEI